MALPRSVSLLGEQFAALYVKNALVAWRARRATILRLLAPFLFLLLALLIDRALQANDSNSNFFSNVKRPESEPISPIPSCHEDVYIGSKDCIELVYSPNNISAANDIMTRVVSTNQKVIQPARGFPSREATQTFLLANPDFVIAAVHFVFDDVSNPAAKLQGFVVQTNTTVKSFKATVQDPNTFAQLPVQSAVQREIVRYNLNKSPATKSLADTLSWYIGLKEFAHPSISTVSVLGRVLGPFVFAACMFSFVTQVTSVVMEKETGVRQAMRTMGMKESAYWLSWAAWEITMAFLSGHLIAIFGLILHFNLFLHNSYGILFFLFFLFQLAMSSLALTCSAFLHKTQTAVYVGFVIFIVGWIMQTVVIFGVPYTPDAYTTDSTNTFITVVFSAFPWNLLMKGFTDLGAATVSGDSAGIPWRWRGRYCQNIPALDDQNAWSQANGYNPREQFVDFKCVMSLNKIFQVLVVLWIGYLLLAVYLDNVLKNEFGVRRPIFYFLYPSYWLPSITTPHAALAHVLCEDGLGPTEEGVARDEDVMAEESRIRQLLNHRTGHTNKEGELAAAVDVRNAIEMFGLKKEYRSEYCCGCCTSSKPGFWPIKGTWLAIEQNQLFCLLGPNGAGKTTTINCLTGVVPTTYGDALVYGQSIRSAGGMDKIRSLMGVCPQFDVLWPELSGRQHLMLYGRIKGCGWHNSVVQADSLLDKVKLTYAATQRTGAYSGGMKRRLSVAIALLGDPKVVYLDEPTTGMDPISRRYVWDIIQEAKVGRAIVLTTHSMEEADILGDRIAIMALGRLRCLGTSLRLKQRFGAGYQVAVSVQPGAGAQVDASVLAARSAAVEKVFSQQLGLVPEDKGRSYTTYLIPREREPELVTFLAYLESQSDQLGLTDIQISLTSLEEVFLTIARNAALESAMTGGNQEAMRRRDNERSGCSICLRGTALALCFPWSLCCLYNSRWRKFLFGKEEDHQDYATLPDGTAIPVQLGQEYVRDSAGGVWQVIWSVDEGGNLVVQDTKPTTAEAAAAAAMRAGVAANASTGSAMSYPAVDGKARVPLPGNVIMEVRVGDSYVMNPHDGSTYAITWGKDTQGQDAVLACSLASSTPAAQQQLGSNGPWVPVGQPLPGTAPAAYQPQGYNGAANGQGVAVGESRAHLPGQIPSPRQR